MHASLVKYRFGNLFHCYTLYSLFYKEATALGTTEGVTAVDEVVEAASATSGAATFVETDE